MRRWRRSISPEASSTDGFCRQASAASRGLFPQLDTPNEAATLFRPPVREARKALRPARSAFARFGYDQLVARRIGGLWRERRPFRCPPFPASVLENSTACVCDEKRCRADPVRSAGWGRSMSSIPSNLVSPSRWDEVLTPLSDVSRDVVRARRKTSVRLA